MTDCTVRYSLLLVEYQDIRESYTFFVGSHALTVHSSAAQESEVKEIIQLRFMPAA